jgi:MEDS: MEthanogen/methylotroph, DcmR Sensory domain
VTDKTQTIFQGYAEDISKQLRRSEIGSHFLVGYPDLLPLREMYSHYTKSALYEGNEIVVILPYYETADSVRSILSEDPACLDVAKYEKEQRLLITDSLKGYFSSLDGIMPFVKQIVEYAKTSGRSNVTVLGDMGSFFYYENKRNLIEYETQLPHKFGMNMKGICLYHMIDFRRFSDADRQKLYRHHNKIMQLLPSQDDD